jgi:hypothetical protein
MTMLSHVRLEGGGGSHRKGHASCDGSSRPVGDGVIRHGGGASSAIRALGVNGEVAGVALAVFEVVGDGGSARGGGLVAGGPPSPCSWVC